MQAEHFMDSLRKGKLNGNAAYIVFGESLLSNLIRRQVLDVVTNLRNDLNVDRYYLVAFVNWDEFLRNKYRIKKVLDDLNRKHIMSRIIPIPFSVPMYDLKEGWKMKMTYNLFTIPLVAFFTLPVIMFYALFCGVRLFHCRSYLSALQVLITKLLFKNIGFIFDPRSDYPEETAFQKKWSKNSLNYKFWKYLEKQFLKYSDTVIAISDTFDNHIKRIYANAKSIVIYNNVDTTAFDYNEEFRSDYRKIRHIDEKTVFCYSGSLHGNNWNDPEIYCKFIYYYTRWYDDRCLFLFLMPEYCNRELVRALKSYDINERYFLIESPRFTELPKYISAGDICIYFLPYYSPRVGTKFVEYCSVGLPIIVNEKVGGAVELINKFKLGVVIKDLEASGGNDESKTETKLILRDLIERKEEYRKRCREFAKNNFSNKIVIGKYSCVYKNLLLHDKLGG